MKKHILVTALLLTFSTPLVAQPTSSEESVESPGLGENNQVIASQGGASLTHAELDAAFARIPAKHRLAFIRDGEKVDQVVRSLLRDKILAQEAMNDGFSEDKLNKIRMELAGTRELADAWMDYRLETLAEADLEQLAHEHYLANKDNFMTQAAVGVTHILISSENKPDEQAREMAWSLYEQLQEDPTRFDEFVTEHSEDPSKSVNNGAFPNVVPGQMVEPFEKAAFALTEIGSISEPVETQYGLHIIRLDRSEPSRNQTFNEVKTQLIVEVRQKYENDSQMAYLRPLLTQPIDISPGEIEVMVKRYFGDDLSAVVLSGEE